MFAALEAAIVLKLDAQIRMPTVGLTTTTRAPDFGFKRLRKAEQALWRQLRRDLGPLDIQYVGFLEWTTGKGTRAAGHRRPHLHHLVKGIPSDHEELGELWIDGRDGEPVKTTPLEQRVSDLWFRFTGDAWIVECRPLLTPAGAIAYLALHHHKRSQAPPPGFKGRRLRPSVGRRGRRGYYELPIRELRELARELASDSRVRSAVRRVIDVEFYGAEQPEQYELDGQMTEAMVAGLRELARHPPVAQRDLFTGEVPDDVDRQELRRLMVAELERIRSERRPELVRVSEREDVDEETGVTFRRATAILGPVDAWRKPHGFDVERPVDAIQLRLAAVA